MPTALITGASMGLGAEYARLFAADGHDVVLVARSEDRLRALADELRAAHSIEATIVSADLADAAAPAAIGRAIADRPIEFLVNNAGFGDNGPFHVLDLDRQLAQVAVNVTALTHLTGLFLPPMIERRSGRILNVASTAAFQPGPGMAVYYATKAYVVSLSEAIAHEVRGTGVRVTCHCPGATATAFAGKAGNANSWLFRLGAAEPKRVARHGYRAMIKGRVLSIHGLVNLLSMESLRLAPRAVVRRVTALLNS